jgi:hypothetical protein
MNVAGEGGTSVFTRQDLLDENTTLLTCPFSLAIDYPLAKTALVNTLGADSKDEISKLSERETICTYIVLHWCVNSSWDPWSVF